MTTRASNHDMADAIQVTLELPPCKFTTYFKTENDDGLNANGYTTISQQAG